MAADGIRPWWKPLKQDTPTGNQWKRAPLGALDTAALNVYEAWLEALDGEGFLQMFEDLLVKTRPDLAEEEDEDKFYDAMEKLEQKVYMRAARAVINNIQGRPDRVAHEAFKRSAEEATQT